MADVPTTENRHILAEQLERAAGNLSGKQQRRALQFVDDKTICGTCKSAHLMRRSSQNTLTIYCCYLGGYVPHDLTECSKYRSITDLSLDQMTDIAVLLDQRDLLKDSYR